MALIIRGKSECPLCGNVIMDGDEIVATSPFIADSNDPLWEFSDAGMHRSCFLTWDQREAFVAKFNQLIGQKTFSDGTYDQMESDGMIAVLKRDD